MCEVGHNIMIRNSKLPLPTEEVVYADGSVDDDDDLY